MALDFHYRARSADGGIVNGRMRARDRETVTASLRSRALFVTAIDAETPVRGSLLRMLAIGRVRQAALLTFFRSFATLLRAGVAMRSALTVTIERCVDGVLQEALRAVLAEIERGVPLSEAFAARPRIFSALHCSMIRAGERGGILEDVVERVATLIERDAALVKKLRTALAYPSIVVTAALGLVVLLIVKIVPMFAEMFASFNVAIPAPTRALLAISALLQTPLLWLGLGGGFAAALLTLRQVLRSERGSVALDRARFRVPLVGSLARKAVLARVARMLGTLVRSGIDLLAAIDAVAPVAASPLYRTTLLGCSVALRAGEPLSAPLTLSGAFDPLFMALVRVGEETGSLDEMLIKIAEYFESDIESALAVLSATIEPVLVIVLGAIVGTIVFSVFLPLYSLIGSLAR
jgi:type IV pilus assembly protein PilC